jgi:lipoyl(octanoyl) transferase
MSGRVLEVVQAGRVPYAEALDWQRRLAEDRIARRLPHDLLLLLEHPPVVTLGRNSHDVNVLRTDGIEVYDVEGAAMSPTTARVSSSAIRSSISPTSPDLHWYLRTLEQALIDALALLGCLPNGTRLHRRVDTGARRSRASGSTKQWVTWHGFALNVTTDLIVRPDRAVRHPGRRDDIGRARVGNPSERLVGRYRGRGRARLRGGLYGPGVRHHGRAPPVNGGVEPHPMTERLPPGQVLTTKWPVLHFGLVPSVDSAAWAFTVDGLVERPLTLTYDEPLALPRTTVR